MSMPREVSERIARALRSASDEARWSPCEVAHGRLLDLERFLAIRIQAGQPALEAMNGSLVDAAAVHLMTMATQAMSTGRISTPTVAEMSLFGRPPTPALRVVSPAPLLDVLAQAA